jgi:hypothetical protein
MCDVGQCESVQRSIMISSALQTILSTHYWDLLVTVGLQSMAPSIVECLSRTTSFNKEGTSTPYNAAAALAPFERSVPGSSTDCNGLSFGNNLRPSLFKKKDKTSPSDSCPTTIYIDTR